MSAALSDVTVIDLTTVRSGPTCTKILADFGAEVVRVERPGEADRGRVMSGLMWLTGTEESAPLRVGIPIGDLLAGYFCAMGIEHPAFGPVKVLRLPLGLSRTPPTVRTPAPVPGAHTREVLAALGYAPAEIDALAEAGVVEVTK